MPPLFKSLAIIFIAVFAVYLPSLTAEICHLDDIGMYNSLSAAQHFDLTGTLFPQSHNGFYYRPMNQLSFLIDRFIWNLDPYIMHLENILIHFINTALVFIVARVTIPKSSKLQLISALLFAVHPITAESVNWISGRTDLLATLFVLTSLYSFLIFRSSKQVRYLCVAIIALFLGILSKETTFGFIPAILFILTSKDNSDSYIPCAQLVQKQSPNVFFVAAILSVTSALFLSNYYVPIGIVITYFLFVLWSSREKLNGATLRKNVLLISGSASIIVALFWGVRKLAFSSQTPQIHRTVGLIFTDFNYTLSLFFRAAGFYVKKFVYPLPLNFVIRDVSPLYALFGIFLLCLVVVLIVRRKLPDVLVIAGFWMIAPVFLLTFESVAWTSYAERYVYPAAPFWILALAGYADSAGFERISLPVQRLCLSVVSLLIIIMAAVTYQRSLVWQTNLDLFEDSVEKTPDYKRVRGLYMGALFYQGRYAEALHQYQIAQALQTIQIKYNPIYDLFYVQILINQKKFAKAEHELDVVDRKTDGKRQEVFELYLEFLSQFILKTTDQAEKRRLASKLSDSYDRLYDLTKNPMILYRKGQFMLSQQRKNEAGELFARAAAAFPENDPFKGYAKKLARTLTERK
jgi:tetratricopeptide (TPR) repeat protein